MKNEHIEWISIDDLIQMLEEQKGAHEGDGTVPVCVNGISAFFLNPMPYYYDGGYFALDAQDVHNVKHSRDGQQMSKGFHKSCVELCARDDDPHMRFEGRSVMEVDPDRWDWYDKQQQEERAIFDGQLIKFTVAKERHEEWDCYPFTAHVDSGESAMGRNMKDAKEALRKIYEPNDKTS